MSFRLFTVVLSVVVYSALAKAQEARVRYSEISLKSAVVADELLTRDIDAVPKKSPDADLSFRVVGGQDVVLANFYEVVRLRFSDRRGEHVCTGVLLAVDTILTAGHCGCGSNYRADFQLTSTQSDSGQIFVPLTVSGGPIPFPGYDCRRVGETQIGRDLALLRVVPFVYEDRTAKHVMMTGERTEVLLDFPVIRSTIQVLSRPDLKSLYIVGFGSTEAGTLARNLQGANVEIMSRHCQRGRVFASYCAMFREFVLGRRTFDRGSRPVDACGGDSGGPVYRMDTDLRFDPWALKANDVSHRTLIGIVSRALNGVVHPYPGYCGGGGIYTAVGTRPVLDWLRSENVDFLYDQEPVYQRDAEQ